jgi:hypothetical protein
MSDEPMIPKLNELGEAVAKVLDDAAETMRRLTEVVAERDHLRVEALAQAVAERRAIVAWLRSESRAAGHGGAAHYAEEIERGRHLKPEAGRPGGGPGRLRPAQRGLRQTRQWERGAR